MRCTNCGLENDASLRFCKACGTRLPLEAYSTENHGAQLGGREAQANVTKPGTSGSASSTIVSEQTITCGTCKRINPIDKKFCGQCGSKLNAASASSIPVSSDENKFTSPEAISEGAELSNNLTTIIPPETLQSLSSSTFDPLATFPGTSAKDEPISVAQTLAPITAPPATAVTPPLASSSGSGSSSGNSKNSLRNGLIIGVVVLLVMALGGGGLWLLQSRGGAQPTPSIPSVVISPPPAIIPDAPSKELYGQPLPTPVPNLNKPIEPAARVDSATVPDAGTVAPTTGGSPGQVASAPSAPAVTVMPAAPAASPASATSPETKTVTKPGAPTPPPKRPAPKAPSSRPLNTPIAVNSEPAWYVNLKTELSRCESKGNFFSKVYCQNRAKEQFCPNNWGKVKECIRPAHRENEQ